MVQGGACPVTSLGKLLLDSSFQRRSVASLMKSSLRSQEHIVGKSLQTTLQRTPQNPKAKAIPGAGGKSGRCLHLLKGSFG